MTFQNSESRVESSMSIAMQSNLPFEKLLWLNIVKRAKICVCVCFFFKLKGGKVQQNKDAESNLTTPLCTNNVPKKQKILIRMHSNRHINRDTSYIFQVRKHSIKSNICMNMNGIHPHVVYHRQNSSIYNLFSFHLIKSILQYFCKTYFKLPQIHLYDTMTLTKVRDCMSE